MSQILVKEMSFSYDNGMDLIFDNVDLVLDTSWKLGLIGRNGRGKTTFLKLLMGQLKYSGKISSSTTFDYFPFEVKDDEMSVLDFMMEKVPNIELWQIKRELNLLEVDEGCHYMRLCDLSGGERTKVFLAALFLKDERFLLIDEPTNHLDLKGREAVGRYLNSKKGYILVSHDKAFLDSCVDHILAINRAGLEVQSGNFSSWQVNKELKDGFELKQNEKLLGEIKRLKQASIEKAEWSSKAEGKKKREASDRSFIDKGFLGHKAAKLMQASKNIERRQQGAIEEKSSLLKNVELEEEIDFTPFDFKVGKSERLLEVKDLSIQFSDRLIFSSLSFEINVGDRLWLKGSNGSGKTALIKAILEKSDGFSGTIAKKSGLKISYLPQIVELPDLSFREYAIENELDSTQFFTLLAKLGINREHYYLKLSDLSLGQRKKVAIAKALLTPCHLYIWDEPLNYIDLYSRIQIENAVLKYRPTLLFVEHDRAFSEAISSAVVDLDAT